MIIRNNIKATINRVPRNRKVEISGNSDTMICLDLASSKNEIYIAAIWNRYYISPWLNLKFRFLANVKIKSIHFKSPLYLGVVYKLRNALGGRGLTICYEPFWTGFAFCVTRGVWKIEKSCYVIYGHPIICISFFEVAKSRQII